MSLTPPLYPSKKSHPRPHSVYTSAPTVSDTTPRSHLAWPRPSSTWRIATSPTLHMLSRMASSQWCDDAQPSPTNDLPKLTAESTNSPGQYTPTKVRYAISGMVIETLTCPLSLNVTGDEWTYKCPPTTVRTSLPTRSESWGMVKSSPEQESTLTSQNMWSPSTFHQTTHSDPPPPYCNGSWSSSKPEGGPTTPWLRRHIASNTPPPSPKWNITVTTTNAMLSSRSTGEPSSLKSNEKMKPYRGSNTAWRHMAFTSNLPNSKAEWTSATTSPCAITPCATQTLTATATVDQEVLPKREVMLPPKQAAELLPWYMQWSRDLAAEMHCRCLVRNKAHHTDPPPLSRECGCDSEWWCEPHDACFIHDSCFCPSSGSFPPVKPPHM